MPEWITTVYQWIVYLTPVWGLLLAVFWKPLKHIVSLAYEKFVGKPDEENKEEISEHDRRLDEIDKRLKHVEVQIDQRIRVSRALLHHLIFQSAKEALANGCITDYELENLEELYLPYKEIGGNGTAEKLYHDCQNLPIVYLRGTEVRNETD